ncbi:Glycosyltransferase [Tumidithrix helvetica PCC 7403]|uniref:glycosyltransferase n=1 Tax=Tumidithrix helvetica TaxID=3457545 RepID=UPI003CAC4B4C
MSKAPKVLCLNTGGEGSLDSRRSKSLGSRLQAEVTYLDLNRKIGKLSASKEIWQVITSTKWDLIYQEGSGIAGGINLIRAAQNWQQPYIISTGDPIGGFFRVTKGMAIGNLMEIYERSLYKHCTAFIGWTPYLTGAAIKLGAKRAITIEGGAEFEVFKPRSLTEKSVLREKYGIPQEHLVCGVVGSLQWNKRNAYSYGYELIESLKLVKRSDLTILIVGDGDSRERLQSLVPESLRSRAIFTGRLLPNEVVEAMNVMDIGFVTQTLDELGNFRLTTKLPEYLACGVPVAMSPIPGFYDYDVVSAGWALPAYHPASHEFHTRCAQWLDNLTWEDVKAKADKAPAIAQKYFNYEEIAHRFATFVHELLGVAETKSYSKNQ